MSGKIGFYPPKYIRSVVVTVPLGNWRLVGGKGKQKLGALGKPPALFCYYLVFLVSSERNIFKHMEHCTLVY